MEFDLDRVRKNVQQADTDDLLDRATVFRGALEPEALTLVLKELQSRGIAPTEIVAHEVACKDSLCDEQGTAHCCSRCRKPAIVRCWVWHRLFGKVPVFPRLANYCREHAPT